MKNKRGFTLIELLAVIVILAIIALIATPIVMNVIENSKKGAAERSVENYLRAVETAVAVAKLEQEKLPAGGYVVDSEGNLVIGQTKLEIEINGTKPDEGSMVYIENYQVNSSRTQILLNNNILLFNGNKFETNDTVSLIDGPSFNKTIKNLVNNTTDADLETVEESLKSIIFLSNGQLPENYTLDSLLSLEKQVDLSVGGKKSIIGLYDEEDTLYIYSEDLISFNVDSKYMFSYFTALTELEFNNIDTSNLEDMERMFKECRSLLNLDLSNFNTVKVIDMAGMFSGCSKLTTLDLSNFYTNNVENMTYMFSFMTNLNNLNLSTFNTSKVTDMNGMFYNSSELTDLDLTMFDISSVALMELMFNKCSNLKNIYVNKEWDTTGKVTDYMFSGCGTSSVTVVE